MSILFVSGKAVSLVHDIFISGLFWLISCFNLFNSSIDNHDSFIESEHANSFQSWVEIGHISSQLFSSINAPVLSLFQVHDSLDSSSFCIFQ